MSGLTLEDVRNIAKPRADMDNSAYVSDDEWDNYLNDAGAELHDLILLCDPQSIITINTISIVSGTESYALPAAFYKASAVYRMESGIRYAMDRTDLHGLGDGTSSLVTYTNGGRVSQYAIAGSLIYFYPMPTSTDSVQLWYYPSYTRLTENDDTFDYPIVNGWEQYIVLCAVIKAKMKEESDIQAELAEKAEIKERIMKMATSRDNFNPPSVRDEYGATSRMYRYNPYGPRRLTNWW